MRLAYVAQRFYRDGKTQIEIGKELGLSRFKVARLIEEASARGVVKIQIDVPGPIDTELSLRVKTEFGLNRCLVVMTPADDAETIRSALGGVVATLLTEIVQDGEILGLSSGRTLIEMARRMTTIAECDVVQLTGVADPDQDRGMEAINRISAISGGRAYSLYAPLVVSDAAAAAAIRRQPSIQRTLSRIDAVTTAVVTVGSWPGGSLLHDSLSENGEAARLVSQGVCAEIGATLLDAEGRPLEILKHRSIASTSDQLMKIPELIAVGGGPAKTEAVRAALKSGMVTSLVTDVGVARSLVDER
jgi:DNA-binding transcriptional regulator LsrR (DeoR family)